MTSLDRQSIAILVLLFTGVFCTAAIAPFMGFFIVTGLHYPPWAISVYAVTLMSLTLCTNRLFGAWVDQGRMISPLILLSILSFITAMLVMTVSPGFWTLLTIGSLCLSLANASLSTMYSFGRLYAERSGLNVEQYNSYLRTMTSLGWMLAPLSSFYIAGQWGAEWVFRLAIVLGLVWVLVWRKAMPPAFAATSAPKRQGAQTQADRDQDRGLYGATLVCLLFALGHMLNTSALPLFFTQEAGLPEYAPGLALTVKCIMEVPAILCSPWLIRRFGAKTVLCAAAVLAVITFAVLAQVQTLLHLVIGSVLDGVYYGLFAGVGISFVQSFANGRMGRATSFYMNSLFVGGMLASLLMGSIASLYDFRTAILSAAIAMIAAFVLLLVTSHRKTTASAA